MHDCTQARCRASWCIYPFHCQDGGNAVLYSANRRETVVRHMRWNKDYSIEGGALTSDWYLRLLGAASRMLRGETGLTDTIIPITP